MRGIIREWFLYTLSLFVLDRALSFVSTSNFEVLIASGTALYLLNTLGRPLLKILWLPINIVTLGLFSWVINIVVILLVIFFVPGFLITEFSSPAVQVGRLYLPEIHLKLIWTYFLFTFILSWMVEFLHWLLIAD